ncbi:MAG: DUF805 domain-containing protein [Bifidobacteriaceae bacterium]|nr:DUF805 domain-containing protein [Bifidobacteriaceae bacterium]
MTYPGPPASAGAPVPLDQPYYGASMGVAIVRFFKKYATFSGRASRSEYWWWFLFATIVGFVITIPFVVWLFGMLPSFFELLADTMDAQSYGYSEPDPALYLRGHEPGGLAMASLAAASIWSLATFVPTLAINWRRLHDAGFSGAFYLLNLANLGIVPLIMCILASKPQGARFDQNATGYPTAPPAGYGPPPTGYGQPYAPPGYGYPPPAAPPPAQPYGAPPQPPVPAPEIGPDGLPRYPG